LTFAVPALWVAAVVAWATGVAPSSVIGIPLLIGIALSFMRPGVDARAELARAFGRQAAFRAYPQLFERAGTESFEAPLLQRNVEELRTGAFAATQQMKGLARLAHLADLRSSGMLYVPVQLVTLWDSHVLRRVDRWRMTIGPHVRDWFDALGRIEALSALATLAHDHPEWPFPAISDEANIAAEGLGHPMLPTAQRVDNDVTLGPPGTFLLITGSNMSGKSTLLRSIGLNLRLAMAGAPVCAISLALPRAELRTSFHVEDSLTDGVSLFMAQLQRVKAIVDAARDAAARGVVLVYLMDEMLAGTNTDERRIAATRVIRHLVELGAIGAVTTHDLALAAVPELQVSAVPVHFRETVHPGQEPALTFDYRLREGVATSTNALKLMEIVGLD
jgi:DNA mismatch repair ATPase MutS